jgi:hypothetical protein
MNAKGFRDLFELELKDGLVPLPVHKFRILNAGLGYKPEAQAKYGFQAYLRRLAQS